MCVFVQTAGQPGRRQFNKSRNSWPQALSSLVLISVSGFQPVANCSLISQSQEALTTLCSQLQGSRPAQTVQVCFLANETWPTSPGLCDPPLHKIGGLGGIGGVVMLSGEGSGDQACSDLLSHPHPPQPLQLSKSGQIQRDRNDLKVET